MKNHEETSMLFYNRALVGGSAGSGVVAETGTGAGGGGTTVGRCTSSWRVMRNCRPGAQNRGGGDQRRSHGATRPAALARTGPVGTEVDGVYGAPGEMATTEGAHGPVRKWQGPALRIF